MDNVPGQGEAIDVDRHPFAIVHHSAARRPHRVAVDDGTVRLTYAQLMQAALLLAPRIAAAVPPGGLVALLVPNDARFPLALLAALLSDRVVAPIDPGYPAAYVAATLRVARPDVVVVAPDITTEGVPRLELPPPEAAALADAMPPAPEIPDARPDELGLVMFTSGSTGLPKGVAMPRLTLPRGAWWIGQYIGLTEADRVLSLQSFCTSPGLTDTYAALASGATLHLAPLRTQGLGVAERTLREARITVASMVPSVLRALLRLPDIAGAFAATRLIRLAGEPVLDHDVTAARAVLADAAELLVDFGATEAGGILAGLIPRDEVLPPGPVPLGRAHTDLAVRLEDADGNAVPAGAEGLLSLRGRAVALGYWDEGRIDAANFPPGPGGADGRVMRTGDLFRARADGVLHIIGRADRQVKINGVRVEPGQTESILRAQPGVEDTAVLARQMPAGPVLVAFATLAAGAATHAEELRAALARLLPPPQRPSRLHVLPRMPYLAGGKVDQSALLAHDDAAAARGATPEAPVAGGDDAVTRAVLAAWRRVLGHPPGRPDAAFDSDGGDSLGLLQVILHVERALGVTLRPDRFDLGMTAAALARAIGGALRGEGAGTAEGPDIILLPGVGGIGPSMARFRGSLAGEMNGVSLDYGEWPDWIGDPAFRFEALLDRMEADVLAHAPDGPIRLAGHSLGGFLSFVLAQRLRARGRAIGFVGLLDSGADTGLDGGPPQRNWRGEIARLWQPAARGGGLAGVSVPIARVLATRACAPLLRGMIGRTTRALPGDFDMHMRHRLNMMLMIRLSNEWRRGAGPLGRLDDVPVVLFRAEKRYNAADAPDLGWGAHCNNLRVIPVPGDHGSMLKPPHLATLRAAFVSAVQASC